MKRLLVALLLLAAPAEPATYWVRPDGSNLKQGAFDGRDWTKAHALSVAWCNANLLAGDTCRIYQGNYSTPINPVHGGIPSVFGTDSLRITYLGQVGRPDLAIVPSIQIDSSATSVGDYITVSSVTVAGDANWVGGNGHGGRYHARRDSIVGCVIRGGVSVNGGYNFFKDCRIGDGTIGDTFTLTYDGDTAANYYRSFAAKRNTFEDCAFDLQITGSTSPAITWRCQDSLLVSRCRFRARIATGGSSLHLWTMYGMTNSLVEDCYFEGATMTATNSHFPSTRDVFHHNSFVRDTIVEMPGGAANLDLALMTSGDVRIPGEYNGHNSYTDMRVRVGSFVEYQDVSAGDSHFGCVYITGSPFKMSNCSSGCVTPNDSLTFRHNTFISLGSRVLEPFRIAHSTVKGNIFARYSTSSVCGGLVGYFTSTPGDVDSNMVWTRTAADSSRMFDYGYVSGCDYKSLGQWCALTHLDAGSKFKSPALRDTLSWQTISFVPDSLSAAYDASWPDGYVGAVNGYADVTAPVVALTSPCPYTSDPLPFSGSVDICWTATDNKAVTALSLYYSKSTTPTTWVLIASGLAASGTYTWGYPLIYESRINIRAVATDGAGNTGQDIVVVTKQCGSPCLDDSPDTYREPIEP